jgi:hypothetical protein
MLVAVAVALTHHVPTLLVQVALVVVVTVLFLQP